MLRPLLSTCLRQGRGYVHRLIPQHVALLSTSSAQAADRPMQSFVTKTLEQEFSPHHLEVLNESHGGQHLESHFKVVIVSDAFTGKPLIQQHRLVKATLQDDDGQLPFHSLSIVSYAPDKWDPKTVPASPKCAGGDGPK